MDSPWDTGDMDRNWRGYFIPGTTLLRNRVDATTVADLRDAENDLVESRLIELREAPELVGDRSYDLAFLCRIHRQLFQDVYEWAGIIRTVGLEKGAVSFCPPASIGQPMVHVADKIRELDQLKGVAGSDLSGEVAYLYDFVNYAHPFREGNGRSTREFFDFLLAERSSGLDWAEVESDELHAACHQARAEYDLVGLTTMFDRILDEEPAYEY